MEFKYFSKGDIQEEKLIEIKLNPLTDGFVNNSPHKATDDKYNALIIGTNGDSRKADSEEICIILERLKNCAGSLMLGDSDYIVLFNDEKAFDLEEGRFFVGSMMVMKMNDENLCPLSDDEISEVKELLQDRMAILISGDHQFSALTLS